jgi:hypothetical protein
MKAMRHSDIRLTSKTYTDTGLLPVSDALSRQDRTVKNHARYRVRTCDPYRVKVVLYH